MKHATAEFNNFIRLGGWEFAPLKCVTESNRKSISAKQALKNEDEIDGSMRLKCSNATLGLMMVLDAGFSERLSPASTGEVLKSQIAINLENHNQG